jgi:hypothetical protein
LGYLTCGEEVNNWGKKPADPERWHDPVIERAGLLGELAGCHARIAVLADKNTALRQRLVEAEEEKLPKKCAVNVLKIERQDARQRAEKAEADNRALGTAIDSARKEAERSAVLLRQESEMRWKAVRERNEAEAELAVATWWRQFYAGFWSVAQRAYEAELVPLKEWQAMARAVNPTVGEYCDGQIAAMRRHFAREEGS